jgi:hypothetical protein
MTRLVPGAIAVAATALAVAACSTASSTAGTTSPVGTSAPAATTAPAQPETEAGVRAVATQFYGLYAAGQWASAWDDLTPTDQAAIPAATFTAVHGGCPSPSAGLARVIKGITLAGSTAVVTETVAGTASALGTAADAWQYADGRWGFQLSASSLAVYTHGSASADIAAAMAAGECASS